MSVESSYPDAWRRRRARKRIVFKLLSIAAVLLVAGTFGLARNAPWTPLALGFLFPVLLMANLVWIWSLLLRCPRCGNQFGMQGKQGTCRENRRSPNPFAKNCMSCGLALRGNR